MASLVPARVDLEPLGSWIVAHVPLPDESRPVAGPGQRFGDRPLALLDADSIGRRLEASVPVLAPT